MNKLYSVIDLEVTIRNTGENAIGGMMASPFHPDNEIVLYGSMAALSARDVPKHVGDDGMYSVSNYVGDLIRHMKECSVLVGQNIKFDLLWLLREHHKETMDFFAKGGTIWDTQQAEYLLSGQQEMMIPLSNKYKNVLTNKGSGIAEKVLTRQGLSDIYGGTEKDDRIKECWDNGIDT